MWRPQVEVLEAAGRRVISPDLRGYGERRLEPAPFSYVRDTEELLDGEHDVADMRAIAAHVADTIEGARLVTVADAAHLPSLERADEVNALLLGFLEEP